MCVYIFIYVCMLICIYKSMYVCMYVCMNVYMFSKYNCENVSACMYCMYVCMCVMIWSYRIATEKISVGRVSDDITFARNHEQVHSLAHVAHPDLMLLHATLT